MPLAGSRGVAGAALPGTAAASAAPTAGAAAATRCRTTPGITCSTVVYNLRYQCTSSSTKENMGSCGGLHRIVNRGTEGVDGIRVPFLPTMLHLPTHD